LTACGGKKEVETYTIGVVNYVPVLDPVLEGFKAKMAELDYVEGENLTYIYNGVISEVDAIDREIESLLEQDVDLIYTLGTPPTQRAKQAVEGTDVPVVFAPVLNPVEEGVVEDIRQPGGNVTGVQSGDYTLKALESLLEIVPAVTQVYVPYHPEDPVSVTSIASLSEVPSTLEVELLLDEVSTLEEMIAAVEALPENAAIFLVTVPSLDAYLSDLIETATEHGIAVGSVGYIEKGVLVVFSTELFAMGEQAARLADQVLHGTDPSDLPVETAEGFLTINLPAAEAAGIEISDAILQRAHTVIH
jgi:putative ABC transport system substrate-binding protein